MIFIVSIILTFGFALSAIFLGFSPNIYRLSDKGFMGRAIQNAELEAMQYGNLYLRAGILDPDNPDKVNNETESLFIYNIIGSGAQERTASFSNITSNITVSKDLNGAVKITVTAHK